MSDAGDLAAFARENPHFISGIEVIGPNLRFREAMPEDAEFTLSLRLDPDKNRHISPTSPDIEAQRQWVAATRKQHMYFIVEHRGRPVGTIRLYDQDGTVCTWGSWILTNDRPDGAPKESALMIYALSDWLGFTSTLFDVRKPNEKVWGFLSRLGAEHIGETDDSYLYSMGRGATREALRDFAPIEVVYAPSP